MTSCVAGDRTLSFTEVRKHLAGDVNGILRVFNFLEHWGLINFMARDGPKEKSQVEIGLASSGPPSSVKISVENRVPSSSAIFNFAQPSSSEAAGSATRGGPMGSLASRKSNYGQSPGDPNSRPVSHEDFVLQQLLCFETLV